MSEVRYEWENDDGGNFRSVVLRMGKKRIGMILAHAGGAVLAGDRSGRVFGNVDDALEELAHQYEQALTKEGAGA